MAPKPNLAVIESALIQAGETEWTNVYQAATPDTAIWWAELSAGEAPVRMHEIVSGVAIEDDLNVT